MHAVNVARRRDNRSAAGLIASSMQRAPTRGGVAGRSPGRTLAALLLTALGAASGCAVSVVPEDDPANDAGDANDAGATPADAATACALPGGGSCARGQTCAERDGCTQCACGDDGQLACTHSACADAAMGTATLRRSGCQTRDDCAHGYLCFHTRAGCDDLGECKYPTYCADDSAPRQFCGCDGLTREVTCGDLGVDVPYTAEGPCS